MNWVVVFPLCYLVGSLPSAYIAGRMFRGMDIRSLGDGNVGAANAFHELGVKVGILVGLVDIGKGAAVVLLARTLTGYETAVLLGGMMAVVGHSWPFFLQFRGGRGAATALGILLILIPRAAFPLMLISAIPMLLFKSTVIFFALVFAPMALVAWYTGATGSQIAFSIVLPVLVGLTHFVTARRSIPGVEGEAEGNASFRA